MPRTDVAVTRITRAGVANPALTAGQADGRMFDNDGGVFLEVSNANAAPRNLTFVTPGTVGDRQIEDLVVAIPASAVRYKVGPFPTDLYNRPVGGTDPGKVYVNFPAGQEADLSIGPFRI